MAGRRLAVGRALAGQLARFPWPVVTFARRTIDGQKADAHLAVVAAAQDRVERDGPELPPVSTREGFRRVARLLGRSVRIHRVEEVVVAERPARVYRPRRDRSPSAPVLVYFHGGGGAIGDLDTADDGCRWLARTSGWTVVSIDYRLGPEHPYPAALDDAMAAFRDVWDRSETLGFDRGRIAVGGDSFGGMLAAQVCRQCAGSERKPSAQLLVYPVCDFGARTRSRNLFATGHLLTETMIRQFTEWAFVEPADALEDRASPLRASHLGGLSPAMIVLAGMDPLRDEGRAYAERLSDDGVRVETVELNGMMHGFIHVLGFSPGALACWRQIGRRWAAFAG